MSKQKKAMANVSAFVEKSAFLSKAVEKYTKEGNDVHMAGDRRVERTKKALTEALFELLGEKDFSKITITELARRADVDRKTFYLHYQTVDEILEEFYDRSIRHLRSELEKEGIFRGQSIDMVGFFRLLGELVGERLPLYRQLAQGRGYTYFEERIRSLLRTAMEDYFRRQGGHSEEELHLLGEFYAAAVIRVYLLWLRGELVMSEEELAETVGKVITGALSL